MFELIFFSLAVVIFAAATWYAIRKYRQKYKRERILTPNRALILGTFFAAFFLFYPLYWEILSDKAKWNEALFLSLQHSARLFALDGDFKEYFLFDLSQEVQWRKILLTLYTVFGAWLHVFAPILTVTFVLTFFRNFDAYRKYWFSFGKEIHIFSELNEKSLALADSILQTCSTDEDKPLIVFTDVLSQEDEKSLDLVEEAREMGVILFSRDLCSIRFRREKSKRQLKFYLISDDEPEKIRHAEHIIKEYDTPDVELRIFSDDIRLELFVSAQNNVNSMKLLRINDIQSLIYHNLDVNGLRLFQNARQIGEEKVISAVIVGLGKYGLEMLKALTWFCQMKEYTIKINAFDKDEHAKDKFEALCPELMSEKFNHNKSISGEAKYDIDIHSGIDTQSRTFSDHLTQIKDATYIFVCLGSDEENLATASRIRSLCEGVSYVGSPRKPDIETVIYDSNIRDSMGIMWGGEKIASDKDYHGGVSNFSDQPYALHMIGDLDHFYSVETLIDSDLVARGEEVNLRWLKEDKEKEVDPKQLEIERNKFYNFEYNYRSSIAKAIHEKLRKDMSDQMGIEFPDTNMPREEILKDQDLCLEIGRMEHVRWNAYMRTEGYSYGPQKNHLAKTHNCLVSVDELMETEQGRKTLMKDV